MTPSGESSSQTIWSATDLHSSPHHAPDKAERVKAMFGAIAPWYDLNNRLHSLGRDQAWRRAAVRLASLRSTDHVLDVACGTGDLTNAMAEGGPATVTGVDFAEPMLAVARRKAARRRRAPGISAPTFRAGDAMALDFDDESFDVVSIAFGIRNVTDPVQALREFRRVLRAGGRLVILEFGRPRNPLVRWVDHLYCRRIMPVTAAWIARDRTGAYRYLPRSVATFADGQTLADMMEQAGFAEVTRHSMTMGICVAYVGRC